MTAPEKSELLRLLDQSAREQRFRGKHVVAGELENTARTVQQDVHPKAPQQERVGRFIGANPDEPIGGPE